MVCRSWGGGLAETRRETRDGTSTPRRTFERARLDEAKALVYGELKARVKDREHAVVLVACERAVGPHVEGGCEMMM